VKVTVGHADALGPAGTTINLYEADSECDAYD
jgi:hypothetical protein